MFFSSVADMRVHKPTRGKTHRHQTGQLQKIIPKSVFHSYIFLYTQVTGVHSGGKTCDTTCDIWQLKEFAMKRDQKRQQPIKNHFFPY